MTMKILCLHGYQGRETALRYQMRGLIKTLEQDAELIFLDAPSIAKGDFGWWHSKQDLETGIKQYKGWQNSLDAVLDTFAKKGPIDGVFGFSQGATFTGLLAGMRESSRAPYLKFRFAMMVGGFMPGDPELAAYFKNESRYALPTLHMIGDYDPIVLPSASEDLARRFKEPLVIKHPGGHSIASTPEICQRVSLFLKDMKVL